MKVTESIVTGYVERKFFEELKKENENLKTQIQKKEEIICRYKSNLQSIFDQLSIHAEKCDDYDNKKIKNVISTLMLLVMLTSGDGKEY